MEPVYGNRYALRGTLQTLPLGQLHEADDLSLHRRVLLYELDPRHSGVNSRSSLLRAAAFTHDSFMHILDIGTGPEGSYAVFKACEGAPLLQQLRRHTFTAEELLVRVYELGQAMLEAAEEGFYGFSVLADNLWDGYGSRFLPIHYWESAEENAKGAYGLCVLLQQMLMKESSVPGMEAIEHRLRLALRELSLDRTESLLALMDRVYREKPALTAFLTQLRPIISGNVVQRSTGPVIVAPAAPEADLPASGTLQAEAKTLGTAAVPDDDDDDDDWQEAESEAAGRRRFWRRFAIVAGSACLFAVVFIGCLTWIFQIGNRSHAVTKPAVNTQPPQVATPAKPSPAVQAASQEASTMEQSAKTNTSDAPPGGPTTVPNLIGLAKADAEKQAIAAGLHYSYLIEANKAKAGTVYKQDPAAGTAAVRGDSMNFWISKGN